MRKLAKHELCNERLDSNVAKIHAVCILDWEHTSSKHWGPDQNGIYREWNKE